jgi:hypothetical protein
MIEINKHTHKHGCLLRDGVILCNYKPRETVHLEDRRRVARRKLKPEWGKNGLSSLVNGDT